MKRFSVKGPRGFAWGGQLTAVRYGRCACGRLRVLLAGGLRLQLLLAWRLRLWEAFAASTRQEQVDAMNRLPTDAAARPYVSTYDDQWPHPHYADENADVVTRVRAATAAGLALVPTEPDPCRLGRCSAVHVSALRELCAGG